MRNGINFLDLGKIRAIMKRFFTAIPLAVALCFCAGAGAQEIRGGNYGTVGYIKSDGTVQDSHYSTLGYVKSDGTVQDSHYKTIGYAKNIPTRWAALFFFFKL